jgi:hypothetical protein
VPARLREGGQPLEVAPIGLADEVGRIVAVLDLPMLRSCIMSPHWERRDAFPAMGVRYKQENATGSKSQPAGAAIADQWNL